MKTDPSTSRNFLKDRTRLSVAFCGGGSGGHLTPAIAVARAWVDENPDIRFQFLFLCSGRAIDQTILGNAELHNCDVEIATQTATTSSRKLPLLNCLRKDLITARQVLKQQQPDLIVGMGGFASVAPVLAAKWLGFHPILMELNATPGRATRWLSRVSTLVWSGWPMDQATEHVVKTRVMPFGIPMNQKTMPHCQSNSPPRTQTSQRLVIAGGSLGASRLNNIACDALAKNRHLLRHWSIEHQTGRNWQPSTAQLKCCEGLNWNRHAFIPHLANQIQTADIVISRAGAVTLAEIANAPVASILVPLSSAADNHQAANTKLFEEVKAAFVVDEVKPSASESLSACLNELVSDEAKRQQMKQYCKKLHCHLIVENASKILASLLPHTPTARQT